MIKHAYSNTDQRGDLVRDGANLLEGDDLKTAWLQSIFTNRRDDSADVSPNGDIFRGGWWADEPGDIWGSRLWTLRKEKATLANINLAKDFLDECLQWMIADKVAESVTNTTWRGTGLYQLGFKTVLQRPFGRDGKWEASWEGLLNEF